MINYRLADENDKEKIIGFYHVEYFKLAEGIFSKQLIDYYEKVGEYYASLVNTNPNFYLFLALEKDKIVGTLPIFLDDKDTKMSALGSFIVKEEYRQKGVGSELLKQAIKLVKQKNQTKLCAAVPKAFIDKNKRLPDFYIKHGFKHENTINDFEKNLIFEGYALNLL
ncbi:GNAT family N-acetyltransferase [Candidatus Micrarchaeota archaeon]|jgi:predicted GNAT family N-acyltransferase|nr:GNAT family N-acetyltransferase [Candidatus Micrarchaeota archaeon]